MSAQSPSTPPYPNLLLQGFNGFLHKVPSLAHCLLILGATLRLGLHLRTGILRQSLKRGLGEGLKAFCVLVDLTWA